MTEDLATRKAQVRKAAHAARRAFADKDGASVSIRARLEAHPAFLVEDVHALARSAEAGGYRIASDELLSGYDRLYVYDPFGNRIELMQRLST